MREPRAGRTTGSRRLATGVGIVALGLGLYLPGLGVEVLRHPLEAKYALAAREMLRGSPLLVPHLFGELYPDKPPLYFWATAGLARVSSGKIDEFTARLPAVVAGVAGLLVTWALGTALFGSRAGVLAALVLATSNLFFWYARQGHPDQFLTTFVTLACLGLWRGLTVTSPGVRLRWIALGYAAMGFGILSKGLLGLVIPVLAAAVYALATGPVRHVARRLGLAPGLGVLLAVVLAWFAPAVARHGPDYFYETVVHQHVVRYARTWAHAAPWYYYLGEFPVGFAPWILFVPSAIALGWPTLRRMRPGSSVDAPARETPPRAPDQAARRPLLFPLGWLVAGLVFFSLASGKRGAYLLPLYPAAALIVGWLWDHVLRTRERTRWMAVPLGLLSGLAALLGIVLALLPRRLVPGRMVDTLVPGDPWHLAAMIGLLLAGAAAIWLPWRARRPAVTLAVLVTVQAALLLGVATVRGPQYEARYPVRDFARLLERRVPPGEPVLSLLHDYNFLVALYLDRKLVPLLGPAELLAARARGRPSYGLIDDDDGALLAAPAVQVLEETRLGPKRVALIRVEPAAD